MSAVPLTPARQDEDRRPQVWAVAIIFTLLPQLVVGMRIYARKVTGQHLWWDDWLIIAAALMAWFQFAFLVQAIKFGMGRHQQVVPLPDVEFYLMWTYASEIWYSVNIVLVKCSILSLYIRMFRVKRGFTKLCYGMLAFVIAWFIAILFSTIFQCSPVQAAWVKTPEMLATATCVDLRNWLIGNNVPNILADVIIIVMPMPLIWNLKLSLMRKLGLCLTFLLAFAATIISIVRVVSNATIEPTDVTWVFVPVATFSTIEGDIGTVCASLPVLAPLMRMAIGKNPIKSSQNASYRAERDNSGRHLPPGANGRAGTHPLRNDTFSRLEDASDTENLWSTPSASSTRGEQAKDSLHMDYLGPIPVATTV